MKVQRTCVTFEQAKWLKEKGFDILCFYYYENGKLREPFLENGSSTDVEFKVELSDLLEYYDQHSKRVSAPEQWQVVEWLRIKHNIWVQISIVPDNKWGYIISNLNKLEAVTEQVNLYERHRNNTALKSPQEAYSAAFYYICLNNLI